MTLEHRQMMFLSLFLACKVYYIIQGFEDLCSSNNY